MNPRDVEALETQLRRLTPLAPDAVRAATTRARCVARLTRPPWQARLAAACAPVSRRVLEPAVATLAAMLFLGDVIVRALRLYGIWGE